MDPHIDEAKPDGLMASARRTLEVILRTLQNRAELFGLELEEEGHWVVAALIWAAAAVFFTVLAIVMITITVVLVVPSEARPWVLLAFSLVYLLLGTIAIFGLRKHVSTRRPPLVDTINELKKDLDCIRPRE